MYKFFTLFILLLISSISGFTQNCEFTQYPTTYCESSKPFNFLMFVDYLKPTVKIQPSLYSINFLLSLQTTSKFTFGLGLGYSKNSETFGTWQTTEKTYGVINSYFTDSTYFENGLLYHQKIIIDVYDTIEITKPFNSIISYDYIKFSFFVSYNFLTTDDFRLNFTFFQDLLIEANRNKDLSGQLENTYQIFYNPRINTFYFFEMIELNLIYDIDFLNYGTIKNDPLFKKISLTLSPKIGYQLVKFQQEYSNFYYGISLGIIIPLN